jgi:hypothetical protein
MTPEMNLEQWGDVAAIVAAVAAVLGLVGGMVALIYRGLWILIGEQSSREKIVSHLEQRNAWQAYRRWVRWGLLKTTLLFGQVSDWKSGLITCCLIALVYPVASFILAWCLGGSAKLSGFTMFPDNITSTWRWLIAAFLGCAAVMGALIGYYIKIFSEKNKEIWENIIFNKFVILSSLSYVIFRGINLHDLAYFLVSIILLICIAKEFLNKYRKFRINVFPTFLIFIMATVYYFYSDTYTLEMIARIIGSFVLFCWIFYSKFSLLLCLLVYPPIFIVISLLFNLNLHSLLFLIIVIYITVPFTNAILDLISITISRVLIRYLIRTKYRILAFCHLLIDIVLAVILLYILAFILPFLIQLMNHGLNAIGQDVVQLYTYFSLAEHDPFGAGIMVTGMILTTLVPTALHLGLAIWALLVMPVFRGHVIGLLRSGPKDSLDKIRIIWNITLSIFVSVGLLFAAGYAIWFGVDTIWGHVIGDSLLWTARCAADLIGGPGAPPLPHPGYCPW